MNGSFLPPSHPPPSRRSPRHSGDFRGGTSGALNIPVINYQRQ